MKRAKTKRTRVNQRITTPERVAVSEHLRELRSRLLLVISVVLLGGTGAYFVQQHIVNWLLSPSHNQQFIYTSPGGGIGFLFSLCTYVGIILAMPFIVYELLAFLSPIIGKTKKWLIAKYSIWSIFLAGIGLIFGYFVGLPAALHFLGNQFSTKQIHPLFTIQEYLSFVSLYLLGSVLIFQLPLLILLINKIKPVKPATLLKAERYIIVLAFIVSVLMVPTVNVMNQLIIAVPIIMMYQVAIALVWVNHRKKRKPGWLVDLLEQDNLVQAEREGRPRSSLPVSYLATD